MIPEFSLCKCEGEYPVGLFHKKLNKVVHSSSYVRTMDAFLDYWIYSWDDGRWVTSPATQLVIPGGLI